MAKRIIKWTLDKVSETATIATILCAAKHLEDPKATAEIMARFDLVKLYPTFEAMNEVQQQIIVYGVKQKLMDVGANEIAEISGKITAAKKKWDELLAGKWSGERVNSTGAAENKAIAAKVKEALAGPVTLQTLVMKQFMHPDQFTSEDQAKLDEFMQIAAGTKKAGAKK